MFMKDNVNETIKFCFRIKAELHYHFFYHFLNDIFKCHLKDDSVVY